MENITNYVVDVIQALKPFNEKRMATAVNSMTREIEDLSWDLTPTEKAGYDFLTAFSFVVAGFIENRQKKRSDLPRVRSFYRLITLWADWLKGRDELTQLQKINKQLKDSLGTNLEILGADSRKVVEL